MTAPDLYLVDLLRLADRQAVYRCYAADGSLLYIGTTGHLGRRLGDHAQKIWFLASARVDLEWFPDAKSATAAERKAIETERPRFNVSHNRAMVAHLAPVSGKRKNRVVLVPTPRPEGSVTIREALAAGLLPGYFTPGSVRTAKHRSAGTFPPPVGVYERKNLYDGASLRAWAAGPQAAVKWSAEEEPA